MAVRRNTGTQRMQGQTSAEIGMLRLNQDTAALTLYGTDRRDVCQAHQNCGHAI